jgi:hypothetical protein
MPIFSSLIPRQGSTKPPSRTYYCDPSQRLHTFADKQAIRRIKMKRRTWYIIPVFLYGFSITIDAFSQKKTNGKRIRNLNGQISDPNEEHCHIGERRKFLETSLGVIASLGTLVSNPYPSEAADSAFGKNGYSKGKLGGLTNKIRKICKNMVCFPLYLLF